MKKRLLYPIVMLMIAALAACNLPAEEPTATPLSIDAAFTAAAQTVEARLTSAAQTQAAAGPPATDTPLPASATPALPTATSTPVVLPTKAQTCDVAEFVTDVTVPDGTNYSAGDTFTKTWRIKNIGTCSWTPSYTLFFSSGNSMNGPSSVALTGNVNPGQSVDLSVNLTAPATAGEYTGYWKLRNAGGLAFTNMYVKITVGGGGSGVTATPGGAFAVTHVDFVSSGGCSSFTTIAQITVNGAGDVSYHWVRSDGATDTEPHPVLTYDEAGTKSVTTSWDTTASGDNWISIYIDEPNHQQIGKAEFTCP
jgi:hypothetical protein